MNKKYRLLNSVCYGFDKNKNKKCDMYEFTGGSGGDAAS